MGNAFLNGVETSQEEAACLLLGILITQMRREVFFINTAPIDERTFILKSMEEIKKMDPESTDVMSSNALTTYKQRSQKHFSNYTLADFVSEIRISFPNTKAREDYYESNTDDYPLEEWKMKICKDTFYCNSKIVLNSQNIMFQELFGMSTITQTKIQKITLEND